jgi:ABC-2 type transport system ATP-binding protein
MIPGMDNSPLMIETRGLTKRFGARPAVTGLDLAVPRGCAFGFLGHNGAGKTTLIRLLVGLTRPDAGTIWIAGRQLATHQQDVLSRVGAMVEEPHFHGHLTGQENLRVAAAVRGPQAAGRIGPTLARVGLSDRAGDRVSNYSQGMRQRLGIARCLLADPGLLILDEPMNGLDPGGIHEMRSMIEGLVAEGRTVFLSSHLIDEIERTCQAVAVIDRGQLIAQGPVSSLAGDDRLHLDIGCDQPQAALSLLAGHPAVARAWLAPGGIRVELADPAGASAVNARLAAAGLAVSRFAPVRASLEDRFLDITSRVGGNA